MQKQRQQYEVASLELKYPKREYFQFRILERIAFDGFESQAYKGCVKGKFLRKCTVIN